MLPSAMVCPIALVSLKSTMPPYLGDARNLLLQKMEVVLSNRLKSLCLVVTLERGLRLR